MSGYKTTLKSFVRFFSYYDASLISDEDYIILYELLIFITNPDFAYESNRFDLNEMNDDECKAEFEVRKCHTFGTSGFRPNGFGCTCVCMHGSVVIHGHFSLINQSN